jgi:hypothetical protein
MRPGRVGRQHEHWVGRLWRRHERRSLLLHPGRRMRPGGGGGGGLGGGRLGPALGRLRRPRPSVELGCSRRCRRLRGRGCCGRQVGRRFRR